jgi:hypothetical protein
MKVAFDADDQAVSFAAQLHKAGFRTQFVVSYTDGVPQSFLFNVECQAFVVSEWVTVTLDNLPSILAGTYQKTKPGTVPFRSW